MAPHVWNLRSGRAFRVLRHALCSARRQSDLRVVHHSVQGNHVHLLAEARAKDAMLRGVRGLLVRIARGLNSMMQRGGRVFADRYHLRVLGSPTEVKNALRYVLCNARHHASERGERLAPTWVDPFSSAALFGGWKRGPPPRALVESLVLRRRCDRNTALGDEVSPAGTWLLRIGWQRAGRIDLDATPGRVPA